MKNLIKAAFIIFLSLIFITFHLNVHADTKADVDKNALMKKVSGLQIPFIENRGQINNKAVKFYANTLSGTVFVTNKGEIVYSLPKTEGKSIVNEAKKTLNISNNIMKTELAQNTITKVIAVRESIKNRNPQIIKGLDKAQTNVNYFNGNKKDEWRTHIPTWQMVSLGEVYKGIELKLRAYGNNIEKLFTVHPEGSVNDIRLKIEGSKELMVNKDGELEIETEIGRVKFTKPMAYQEKKSHQHNISNKEQNKFVSERQYIDVEYILNSRVPSSVIPAEAGIRSY